MRCAKFKKSSLKLFLASAAVLHLLSEARATEADWLYFPMYANDTAHAVHLPALQFRPDGLLASATRYPRFSGEPWTAEESRRGWYNYHPRVIDCETGFNVSKGISLLDKDGAIVAEKPYSHADMVEDLIEKLRESRSRSWPSGSEIFMACVAASSPNLLKQRAAVTKKKQPLISNVPVTADLTRDTSAILRLQNLRFDFDVLAKKRPSSATALFDQLLTQYAAWRKSINKQYTVELTDPARDAEIMRKANAELENQVLQTGALRKLQGAMIEFEEVWLPPYGYSVPKAAAQAKFATILVRADCTSGIDLTVATNWLDASGKVLLSAPVSVKEAMADLKRRYGPERKIAPNLWTRNWGMDGISAAAPYCQLIDQISRPHLESASDGALPFGLTKEIIEKETTPEGMLLRIRAAWRAQ